MGDVTRILGGADAGDPAAARQLLPLVYEELRRLAAQRIANEPPGVTLQTTDLVHEAYLRLVGGDDPGWNGRGHFLAAAAEAMRRILIDRARRRGRRKRGGDRRRIELDDLRDPFDSPDDALLDLDHALDLLAEAYPRPASLVKLRFYAGLSLPAAATTLGISTRTAEREWAFARAWLLDAIDG